MPNVIGLAPNWYNVQDLGKSSSNPSKMKKWSDTPISVSFYHNFTQIDVLLTNEVSN